MRSIRKKIATTLASSVVFTGGIAFNHQPTQAATIAYNFTIDLFSGESFNGMFSFDDSTLTGIGIESLLPTEEGGNVRVTLSIFGETITEEDDVDFTEGLFPAVNFINGEFIGLDILAPVATGEPEFGGFLVVNESFSLITTEYFELLGDGTIAVDGFEEVRGTVSYQQKAVPESVSILSLLALGVMGLGSAWQKNNCRQI